MNIILLFDPGALGHLPYHLREAGSRKYQLRYWLGYLFTYRFEYQFRDFFELELFF